MATYRDISRTAYSPARSAIEIEDINTGSLQRIADAVEAMATYHVTLIRDRDYQKKRKEDEEAANAALRRQNIALRGVITRLKRKAATS